MDDSVTQERRPHCADRSFSIMRILIVIPHYFSERDFGELPGSERYGSSTENRTVRVKTLNASLWSIHQSFGQPQCVIQIDSRRTRAANDCLTAAVDVVVCCLAGRHLLDQLPAVPPKHHRELCDCEPRQLGFECYRVLHERFGNYDWYGYMEDDLLHHDPWLFAKLEWFQQLAGTGAVLLPNRFERGIGHLTTKAYLDGDIPQRTTRPFQDIANRPVIEARVLGQLIRLNRPLNPHSGCWFLSAEQMEAWMKRDDFGSRDASFVGPLESAATLGLMKTFHIYKPSIETASFLEIEHSGSNFVSQLRRPEPVNRT